MARKADFVTRLLMDGKQFDSTIKSSSYQIKKFKSDIGGITSSVKGVIGGFAAFAGVSLAIGDAVRTSMEFEKSMSSLKALTQAGAQEMKFFQSEAIRMSSITTKSAKEVVEAFQLIGGQKADLLQNKAALAEVTEAALVLAEASGVEVPEAAKALMMAMNQMGAKNSEARDYINILAAGAQEGAAEIPYLTQAIEKAGGTANAVGIKFNELVAAIEAIAPKVSDASSAGLYLRNIFLTLEKSADRNLKPSVVGLSTALENLAKKQMDITQLTKMFGAINVTAAMALVKSKDEFNRLTEAVTGTNAAYEQQAIVNNNLAGSVDKAKSAYEAFILTINQSNGVLKESVDLFTSLLNKMTEYAKPRETRLQESLTSGTNKEIAEVDKLIAHYEGLGYARDQAIGIIRNSYIFDESELKKESEALKRMTEDAASYSSMANIAKAGAMAAVSITPGGTALGVAAGAVAQRKVTDEMLKEQEHLVENLEIRKAINSHLDEQLKTQEKIADIVTKTNEDDKKKKKEKPIPILGSKGDLEAQIKELTDMINNKTVGIQTDILIKRDLIQQKLDEISKQEDLFVELGVRLKPLDDSFIAPAVKKAKDNLGTLNNDLKAYIERQSKASENTITSADAMKSLSSGMYDLGGAMDSNAGSWMQWGAKLISAIATAIPSLNALTTAQAATAITGAAASSAAIPVVGWVVALGAVASMVAAFASMPKFATGGIVPGTSFSGDKVMAGLNSGEMVLNHGQQANLFKMLNNPGQSQGTSGNVVFKISGTDLVGVLGNTNRKTKRGR